MKKLVLIFLTIAIFCNKSLALCDFAKDIKENQDGSYSYTRECHVEVGKRVKRLALVEEQTTELEKTIELKDLALTKQKERADKWMATSFQLEDKLRSYDSVANKDKTLHFILGVGVTILSVWAAGQITK